MKEFYNTLAIGENGLYAMVKRVSVKINEEILGRILHMSTNGMIPTGLEDKERIVSLIIGDNARYINGELLTNQLTIEMRLLYNFVTHILFSKIDRFDFISDRDLAIMESIME